MVVRNIDDIKNPYDFLKNPLKDNAGRSNLIQEALVAIINGFGFDFSKNSGIMIALTDPQISPATILANMIKGGDLHRQLITLDKDTHKLVLIDPLRQEIKNLESLSNTFSNIVIGTTQYTPAAGSYSLRVIKDPTNNAVSLGITDSKSTETIIPTQVAVDAIKADIATLKSRVSVLESDNITNKQAIQITDQKVSKNTVDIGNLDSRVKNNETAITNHDNDINALQATSSENKRKVDQLQNKAVTEITSADNSASLTKTSLADGSQKYDISIQSAPLNGVHTLNRENGDVNLESTSKNITWSKNGKGRINANVFEANLISGDADNAIVTSANDGKLYYKPSGSGGGAVDSVNQITGAVLIEAATAVGQDGIGVNTDTSSKKITLSLNADAVSTNLISNQANNQLSVSGTDKKLYVPASSSGVNSVNDLTAAVKIQSKAASASILVEKNTTDNAVELSVLNAGIVSKTAGNIISSKADGLFASAGSPSGGISSLNSLVGDVDLISGNPSTPTVEIIKDDPNKELEFSVKISADANNALSAKADGLFATGGSSGGVDSVNQITGDVKIAADPSLGTIKATTTPLDKTVTLSVPDKVTHINHFYYNTIEGDDVAGKGTAYLPFATFTKTLDFIKAKRATGSKSFSIISQDPVNSGLSYSSEPGIHWGDRSDPSGIVDSSNITLPINQAALDRIKAGALPLYRITNRLVTGDSNEIKIVIGASDTIPSMQQIEAAGYVSTYIVHPDHSKSLITISGTDQLKAPIISRLVVLVEIEEFIEQWQDASKTPPPLINVDCSKLNCSSQDRQLNIDIILRNNSIIHGEIANKPTVQAPFLTISNFGANIHQYLFVSLTGTFSPGSILYNKESIDPNIREFSLITGGTVAASNLIVPNIAPPTPIANSMIYDEGLNRYKRFNKATGAYEPVQGRAGGASPSPADVQETYYFSDQGSDDTGRGTPSQPFQTLNTTITYANSRKQNVNFNNFVIISQKGDSSPISRNVSGSVLTSMINGKLYLNLPQTNLDSGSTINARIDNTIVPSQDQMILKFNSFGSGDCSLTVDVDTVDSPANQKDEMNYTLKLSEMWKSTADTRPTIIFKKGTGTGAFSVVKKINLYVDVDQIIEEAAVSSSPVQCSPIVEVVETGLSNAEFFVYFRNLSQNSAKVLELTQIQPISPVIKSGTPDTTNPVTLKIDLEIANFQSKLFRLPTSSEYDSGKIITDLSSRLNNLNAQTIVSESLQIPTSSSTAKTIGLQNEKIRYKDVNSKDWVVATEKYVQDEIAKSGGGGSSTIISTLNDALFFYGGINFDPISSVCYTPRITWNALAGTDYKDQSAINTKYPNFQTTETVFTYRAIQSTSSTGTVFPKQLWLSEWDGTQSEGNRFFGIAHMKIETASTVTVVDKQDPKFVLHTLTFTSSQSLSDLQSTFIQGTWLELAADDAKSKFVTGVIASQVTAGTGAFSVDVNFIFTNSKLQSSMYTLSELSARTAVNIYINPFPSVIPKETARFQSSIPNGAEATVTKNYFMVAVEGGSDVLKEAILLIPYSPAYASLKETTKRANLGEFLFSAKNIQKPVIDKLASIWSDTVAIGINPMPIPSYVNGDTYRSLLGSVIDMNGNELKLSYAYNPDGISVLHANNPTEFMGSMRDITIDTSNNIVNSGYQLASFADLNDLSMKISAPYTTQDADLYGFLQEGRVESIFIGSSFNTLSNTVNGKSRSVIILDTQLMNINSVADDPASKYITMRGAIYTKNKTLKSVTLHIDGWTVANALYGNVKDRKLTVIGENPLPPLAIPSDSEMTTLGFKSQSDVAPYRGTFYKADGTPTGQLT